MTEHGPLLARFARPTAETRTRIAVLADLHLSVTDSGSWRVSHRTTDRLETTVAMLNRQSDLDGVLFLGDLVQSGRPAEYEAFDAVIDDLQVPWFAIPGNHDLIDWGDGDALTLPEFVDRYAPNAYPVHHRFGDVDILALNSNSSTPEQVADTYRGRLSDETLSWLDRKLATLSDPIVAVHHNLPASREQLMDALSELPVDGGSPAFENADTLVDVLQPHDPALVLTGHVHIPTVRDNRGVREFSLPSLGPYPNAYTVLEVGPAGTDAWLHPISTYDDRLESFVLGYEHCRVQLTAVQLAGLPLVDDSLDSANKS